MKKKILYVITKSNWGGAQRYVYDLATSLPSDRYAVAVACGGDGLLTEKLRAHNIQIFGVKSFQRDISFTKELLSFFELLEIYRTYKPDVVHLNSSKAGGLGALAARILRVPRIIFTAHGWPFWESRKAVHTILIAFLSWLTVLLTHITICISDYDASVGKRMPFGKRKIRMIRNGIAPYSLLSRDDARKKLFDDATVVAHEHDVWVLTNAELTKNKNLTAGIDAVVLHNSRTERKIFYTLMGDGELRRDIKEYISRAQASSYVSMLGFVPDGRTYYKGFDIFLLPSLKEGVPYVLLEAGVAEIPCVATHTGGIPEVLENGKNGFVEPISDAAALADALTKLSENADLRTVFGRAHHKKVVSLFSSERMLSETLTLYS